MATQKQTFSDKFNILSGWFDRNAMVVGGKLHADILDEANGWGEGPEPGRVFMVSAIAEGNTPFDPQRTFTTGVTGTKIPHALLYPARHPSVANYGTDRVGPKAIKGGLTLVPMNQPFQAYTTVYDKAKTYLEGDFLTALADDTDTSVGGLITNTVGSTKVSVPSIAAGTGKTNVPVIGRVDRPPFTDHFGRSVLVFTFHWMPATPVAS